MTLRGTLRRDELEGGTWRLDTWVLVGEVPAHLAGREVVVEGEPIQGMGIAMSGPLFEVRRVRVEGRC